MTPRLATRLDIALAALLAISGYTVAAFKLAALSWDGSWYLFRSLQDGAPFIPHLRYGTYPILWFIVEASKDCPRSENTRRLLRLAARAFSVGITRAELVLLTC